MKTSLFPPLAMVLLAFGSPQQAPAAESGADWLSSRLSPTGAQIVDRGQDYAVYRSITAFTDAANVITLRTNEFTLIENGLNYREGDQWKESEDVLEVLPGGVVARRGPIKAIFSSDLASEAVFDLETTTGIRVRGGVRALHLVDYASGKTIVLGQIKRSVIGELIPPNRLVYRDAFDVSVRADVLYVWKHTYFSQDIVLTTRPVLPEGMQEATTRLEVLTEFEAPQPTIRTTASAQFNDDTVIDFGSLALVMGKAFLTSGEDSSSLGTLNQSADAMPVQKRWHKLPDGRQFLVESVRWTEIAPKLEQLRVAQLSPESRPSNREWPAPVRSAASRRSVALANPRESIDGYVIDFVILPDTPTTTFLSDTTYYVRSSYSSGSAVTFQSRTCVKFTNNAYLLLYGNVTFPPSGPRAVFTSRNDDLFGAKIECVSGEPDSDGNASLHKAAPAIWIYYVDFATEIKNAHIRWAQEGVRYDMNSEVYVTHTLRDSVFEHSTTGVYLNLADASLDIVNSRRCNVATAISGYGYSQNYTGNLTVDCGTINVSQISLRQVEPAIAIRGDKVTVISMDDEASPQRLFKMLSSDGGSTFPTRVAMADGTDGLSQGWADPALAYDSFGNLFLTYIGYTPSWRIVLCVSTDDGASFTQLNDFPGAEGGFPRIAAGPSGRPDVAQAVWVSYRRSSDLVAVGGAIQGVGINNIGASTGIPWTVSSIPNSSVGQPVAIGVGPNGEVLFVHVAVDSVNNKQPPRNVYTSVDEDGLGTALSFASRDTFSVNLGWQVVVPNGGLTELETPPIQTMAWDRGRNTAYLVFPERITDGNGDINIYIRKRTSIAGGSSWSNRILVNDDVTGRIQFHPRIAVDQNSGNVAVSWYDCRGDVLSRKTHIFAAVSRNQFSTAQPFNFQVTPDFSDASNLDMGYGEYAGLDYWNGSLFSVWAGNPNGLSHLDIFFCRIKY